MSARRLLLDILGKLSIERNQFVGLPILRQGGEDFDDELIIVAEHEGFPSFSMGRVAQALGPGEPEAEEFKEAS